MADRTYPDHSFNHMSPQARVSAGLSDKAAWPNLKEVAAGQAQDAARFLDLAVGCARALSEYHACCLIHRHLNPSNILWNESLQEAALLDAGTLPASGSDASASSSFQDSGTRYPDSLAERDLPYMSPEQTGRMNRMVDHRTDMYSLGAVFYELSTGRRPFEASGLREWVHDHIARMPCPPEEAMAGIPAAISDIIMKLLSKAPEQRYQSASSLQSDLEHCRSQWHSRGSIARFQLGASDLPARLWIPQKLYGRERDSSRLIEAFGRICTGQRVLFLVTGPVGTGKTSLIEELYRPATARGAFFIRGHFDCLSQNIPYSGFIRVFRELIRQLLMGDREILERWRQVLENVLGVNARVITDVIPEAELLFGGRPPLPALNPDESRNRFNLVFQDFVQVFATREHPLVISFDDLEYADPASLKLVEALLADSRSEYLLLVATAPSLESQDGSRVQALAAELRQAGAPVEETELEPLASSDVEAMLADILQCRHAECRELAATFREKTLGNPYYINQMLRQAHEQGMLFMDPHHNRWQWDLPGLQSLGLSDNVLDFLNARIGSLGSGIRELLEAASCIGRRFNAEMLAKIVEQPLAEVMFTLDSPEAEGMIWPAEPRYALPGPVSALHRTIYCFSHDRIQEAVHEQLKPRQSSRYHLRIARSLLSGQPDAASPEYLLAIVEHYERSLELLADPSEKLAAARLYLQAGQKVKAANAYEQADHYFTRGLDLLPPAAWEEQFELVFNLNKRKAESQFLLGNHSEAKRIFAILIERCRSPIEKASIYNLMIVLYAVMGRFKENSRLGITALRLFGYQIPDIEDKEAIEAAIHIELARYRSCLGSRPIRALLDIPVHEYEERKVCARITMNMLIPAFVSNPEWLSLLCLLGLNKIMEHGIQPEDDYILASAALVLGTYVGDYHTAHDFCRMALELNENNQALSTRAFICHVASFMVFHWVIPFEESLPYNREAFRTALAAGDYVAAVYATIGWMRMLLSFAHWDLPHVLDETDQAALFYQRIQDYTSIERQKLFRRVILNLMGETPDSESFSDDGLDEREHLEKMRSLHHGTALSNYYLYKTLSHCLYGRNEQALNCSEEGDPYLPYLRSFPMEADYLFLQSLALLKVSRQKGEPVEGLRLNKLNSNLEQLRRWSDSCPNNYMCRYALIRAEKESLDGAILQAQEWYEKALDAASASGQLLYEALALEHAAAYYRQRGLKRIGTAYLREARTVYRRWGAEGKVRLLEQQNRELGPAQSPAGAGDLDFQMGQLDTQSMVRASQAISEEIVLHRLLETLLRTVLEMAGAQQVVLLLADDEEEWAIRAQARSAGREFRFVATGAPETRQDVPRSIINLVGRTQETVILDDANQFHGFFTDPYFVEHRPLSVLCLPLVRQGKTTGVLYLENNLATAAFSPARITALELLAAQAVISLENASLYDQHVQMEEELTAVNQRLFDIIEFLPDPTFVVDREGRAIAWNRALEEMSGLGKDQVLGRGREAYALAFYGFERPLLLDMIHTDKGSVADNYQVVKRGPDTIAAEGYLPLVRKGKGAYVLGSASVLRDIHGSITGAIETVRDISERKAVEEALRLSERRLADIIEFLPDAALVVDADQRVILWNQAMERLSGVKASDICGKDHYEYALPFYGERRPFMMDLLLYPDASYESEYIWLRREGDSIYGESMLKNGHHYLTAAVALRDAEGRVSMAIETVREITEIRRAAEEINRLRHLLENIVDSMSSILVGTDGEGRVTMWNAAAVRQTGLQPQQALKRPIGQVLPLFADQMNNLRLALKEHAAMHVDKVLSVTGGERRYSDIMIYPLVAESVEGAVVRIDDVTEQLHMHEMMIQSEKMMSVGGLAAGMAHELNNPLSGIIQATQNITNRLDPGRPRNRTAAEQCGTSLDAVLSYLEMRNILEFIKGIRESGSRAASIISNMLQFSRRSEARKVPVELSTLLEQTLELAANDYDPARGFDFRLVEIVRDYDREINEIECAPTEIEQVLLNMLKNSAHAMSEQPEPKAAPRIILRTRREDNMALIEIEDNGPGMEESVQKRIFEPFFTTKAPGLGTGLGLSVSYFIIVDNHNGRMSVDSQPGKGTRVSLYLPI